VTDAQALAEVQRLTRQGRVFFTRHANERLAERGATTADVRSALLGATTAAHQPERDTWRIAGGSDTDGDDLTVIVAIEADVIVVTVF
jgi:hypothetical protein